MGVRTIKSGNISIRDRIVGALLYLISNIKAVLIYRKIYCNYFAVITSIWRRKYPIKAIPRASSNHTITLHSHLETNYVTSSLKYHNEISYDIENDTVTILPPSHAENSNSNNNKLELYGGLSNGDCISIFKENIYRSLPAKGRTVIDVGANIGDSSIYFALRGAIKVIGLEPFPKTYDIAKKNIEVNKFSDIVTILLSGCSAKSGYIIIDPNSVATVGDYVVNSSHGTKVPLRTLRDIIEENNMQSLCSEGIILKMDCEGCEYDVILSSAEDTLRCFSHIQIEYHYGYKNLKEKLKKCGFSVLVSGPKYSPSNRNPFKKMGAAFNEYIGYIYARRN
jgi:FkbM family methyltransferase